jgi:hypothetical protein
VETDIYRISGRPKIRWENDVKEVARIRKINNLTKYIQDQVKWKKVFEKTSTQN